jgi:hypothetical protein
VSIAALVAIGVITGFRAGRRAGVMNVRRFGSVAAGSTPRPLAPAVAEDARAHRYKVRRGCDQAAARLADAAVQIVP